MRQQRCIQLCHFGKPCIPSGLEQGIGLGVMSVCQLFNHQLSHFIQGLQVLLEHRQLGWISRIIMRNAGNFFLGS